MRMIKTNKKISIFLVSALLFSPLIYCNTATGGDSKENSAREKKIEKFILPKAIIRVDKAYLIPAKKIELVGIIPNATLEKIVLLFAINRTALLKLRPPHFELNISKIKILELNPDIPVYIEALMNPSALEKARNRFKKTGKFIDVAKMLSANGFPMLLDLENYTLKRWLQVKESHIRVIK